MNHTFKEDKWSTRNLSKRFTRFMAVDKPWDRILYRAKTTQKKHQKA